jgi:hypothetical protein
MKMVMVQLYIILLTSEYGLCLLVAEAVYWELVVGLPLMKVSISIRVCVVGPYIAASREVRVTGGVCRFHHQSDQPIRGKKEGIRVV